MSKLHFILITLFLYSTVLLAQDNSAMIKNIATKATADSTYLVVNQKAGWQFLNSYLSTIGNDSVVIEMILQHDRTINLLQDTFIGRIKSIAYRPTDIRNLTIKLNESVYQFRIEPTGKCYLRLVSGLLPDGASLIIPIRTKYKR